MIDPDGKEIVRVTFTKSEFITPILIERSAIPIFVGINQAPLDSGIRITPVQTFRSSAKPVVGAIVTPAARSMHYIGAAIDFNLTDTRAGNYWNSDGKHNNKSLNSIKQDSPDTLEEFENRFPVRKFINDVKSISASSSLGDNLYVEWGGDFSDIDSIHFEIEGVSRSKWDSLYIESQTQMASKNTCPLIQDIEVRND